uniref:F-box associated domain-containing protein n=1 Tax=Oryza punctata TaxID=4537 RepID=A0A0E0KH81_ORYPU
MMGSLAPRPLLLLRVVLDPIISLETRIGERHIGPHVGGIEWPPESYTLPVFSSRTGLWQERSFTREGQAASTLADMRSDWPSDQRNGVYWRGAFYVRRQTNFVIRISLNDDKYQVIKPPKYSDSYLDFYLGRSEKGVYLVLSKDKCLKVCILDETFSKMKWELKHDKDIRHILLGRPWIIQDINYHKNHHIYADIIEAPGQKKIECEPSKEASLEKFEWISDDENILDNENRVTGGYHEYIDIIGFHPYKEIIILVVS